MELSLSCLVGLYRELNQRIQLLRKSNNKEKFHELFSYKQEIRKILIEKKVLIVSSYGTKQKEVLVENG